MDRLIPVGRLFFAIGLVAFGVMQFIYGDFVAGRAPAWPEGVPGRLVWAYASGAFLVAAGAAIVSGKGGRPMALAAGTVIFAWALLRNLPLAAADSVLGGTWTLAGKSLVCFGGAFAVAGSLPTVAGGGRLRGFVNTRDGFLLLGRVCLSYFLIACGIQHFMFEAFVATLVPAWIPGAYFWTYFAGVALIAGGVGMLLPPTARLAALLSGLMIFLWVFMLHVPRAMSGLHDVRNEWTAVFEALAFSGLAFLFAATLPARRPASKPAYAGAGSAA